MPGEGTLENAFPIRFASAQNLTSFFVNRHLIIGGWAPVGQRHNPDQDLLRGALENQSRTTD